MKYVGPVRTRLAWPPQQWPDNGEDGPLRSGEPLVKPLRRWFNDKAARADWWCSCCECGFRHLFTFEVFRAPQGDNEWWLAIRAFGDDRTRPKKVVRAMAKKE